MGTRLLLAVVVLIAFASGVRLLSVGYLADDWLIMTHVHRHGNAASWTEPWLGTEGASFHRPVFTGLYAAEYALFGADPFAGHVHHLIWHVLATALVFVLIRQLGGEDRGACLGALLFAWNPYHAVSLGWLASRTGTVATTFTLLCAVSWLRWRRRPSALALALAVLAAPLAALTKESGYLAFLVPPIVDLVWVQPRPRPAALLRSWSPFVACGAGLLVLRYVALGTLGGGYGQADGLLAGGDVAAASVPAFLDACVRLIYGVPQEYLGSIISGSADSLPWFSYLGGVLTITILAMAVVPLFRKRALTTVLALAVPQLLLLLLIAGPVLDPVHCQRWYAVIALVSILVGLAISARRTSVTLVSGLVLLALFVTARWQADEIVTDAGHVSQTVIEKVAGELERMPADCDVVFVTGLPPSHEEVPLFWWGFEIAFGPPFRERVTAAPVYPVHRNLALGAEYPWLHHPPLEALLYGSGRAPFQVQVDVHGREASLKTYDYKRQLTRAEAVAGLRTVFKGPPLVAHPLAGTPAIVPADAKALRIQVEAEGLDRVDLFLFVPGKDIRMKRPTPGPLLVTDIWPYIRDTATSRGVETLVYVLAVGFPSDGPPRLSGLMSFSCAPRIPLGDWLRR